METIAIFQQTLAQPIADLPLLGRLLARRWGSLHWWLQADPDYRDALASIEQALTIAHVETNDFEVAFCHLMASYALMGMKRPSEAVSHLEASKALFESLGEPYYVCWALSRMGYLCQVPALLVRRAVLQGLLPRRSAEQGSSKRRASGSPWVGCR